MPFFIGKLLEIPVTTTQDYSLFSVLNTYSTDVWERQIQRIRGHHGLASFIVHPDYIIDQRPRRTYERLLERLVELRARANTWIALPGEINRWWRQRSQLRVTPRGNGWEIVGAGRDRARVGIAQLKKNRLIYRIQAVITPFAIDEPFIGFLGAAGLGLVLLLCVFGRQSRRTAESPAPLGPAAGYGACHNLRLQSPWP